MVILMMAMLAAVCIVAALISRSSVRRRSLLIEEIIRGNFDTKLEEMTSEDLAKIKAAVRHGLAELVHVPQEEWALHVSSASRIRSSVMKELLRASFGLPSKRLEKPPGHRTSATLRLVFGNHAFQRVFGQILRDANEEWIEAAAAGNKMDLRRLRLYTPIHLLIAAALYTLVRLAKVADLLRKVLPASPVKKE